MAIFSFTFKYLADELLRIGRDYPDVKIRILANLSMLESPFSVIPFLENIMIFYGPEERHLVDDFMAEYDAMWNDPESSASGDECRRRRDKRYKEILQERKDARGKTGP